MKMKVIATLIVSLAFAVQAGEVRWGNDTPAGPDTDKVVEESQEILSTTADLFTPDNVNSAMSAIYNATFAPFISSLLNNAQFIALNSISTSMTDETIALASPPSRTVVVSNIADNTNENSPKFKEDEATPIPEPHAIVLLALGGMALLLRRKRAKE